MSKEEIDKLGCIQGTNRQKQKSARAFGACARCNKRKVRCDRSLKNGGCTNCFLDNVECVVNKNLKRHPVLYAKRPHKRKAITRIPDRETCHHDFDHTNQDGELSQSKRKQKEQFNEVDNISTLVGLSETDFEYLYSKGAFTWPGDELRQVLFEAYMTVVHPNMPILGIRQIIEIFLSNDGPRESFSLFLGQAMMAAASTAVMVEKIEALGFSSRQSLTEHFFQKARALHQVGYENDAIANTQTMLLMSFCHTIEPAFEKDAQYWLSNAISMAYRARLHQDWRHHFHFLPRTEIGLRKRLWWTCFLQDRLSHVDRPRCINIESNDIDVPSLTSNDFESVNFVPSLDFFRNMAVDIFSCERFAGAFIHKIAGFVYCESWGVYGKQMVFEF